MLFYLGLPGAAARSFDALDALLPLLADLLNKTGQLPPEYKELLGDVSPVDDAATVDKETIKERSRRSAGMW